MADELLVVAADQDGRPLPVNFLEYADDFEGKLWVEVPSRLVGQQDLRLINHGPGNGHTLLLSIREVRRVLPHFLMKVDQPEGVEDAAADFFNRDTQDIETDGHVIENFFMEEKAEVLEDDTHRSAQPPDSVVGQAQDVDAVDDDLAPRGQDFPKNNLEQSRFPGAAWARDEPEFSLLDVEVDVQESPLAFLVLLGNMIKLNHNAENLVSGRKGT